MPNLDKPPADKASGQPAGVSQGGVNLSPRAIVGIVIAVVCLVFVFSNTGEATLSFLWIDITAAGWIFLFLLLALGFIAGFLIGRNRYKKSA
jgi:lipopolysaccharide assembly protein A